MKQVEKGCAIHFIAVLPHLWDADQSELRIEWGLEGYSQTSQRMEPIRNMLPVTFIMNFSIWFVKDLFTEFTNKVSQL